MGGEAGVRLLIFRSQYAIWGGVAMGGLDSGFTHHFWVVQEII